MPATLNSDEQTAFWSDLKDFIRTDTLVPVVGVELLEVTGEDGSCKSFLALVAEAFAKQEGIAPPLQSGARALNEVAARYVEQKRDDDLKSKVRRLIQALEPQVSPPAALMKVAALPLKLFVTTTCDNLLERAIALQQPQWAGQVRSIHYSPERPNDLPALVKDGPPTVFHLFGQAQSMAEYAVTDEDVLEFMLALHSLERRPSALFRLLYRQNLLFLGCAFPDWLTRFFVRLGKADRFSSTGSKTDWVVGSSAVNLEFVRFLDAFGRRTRCFPLTPLEFVDALARYLPKESLTDPVGSSPPSGRNPERDILPGAVFLSYASEDRALAERIRDALMANHVDCWFDRQQLELGDDWERKIVRNVRHCVLFMPLLTPSTLVKDARFFRHEWWHALQHDRGLPNNATFLIPVATEAVTPDDATLPDEFQRVQWQRVAREGPIDGAFITAVVRVYQRAQLDRHRAEVTSP